MNTVPIDVDTLLEKEAEGIETETDVFQAINVRLLHGMAKESLTLGRVSNPTCYLLQVPETILGPQKAILLIPKNVSILCLESNLNSPTLITSGSDLATTQIRSSTVSHVGICSVLQDVLKEEEATSGSNIEYGYTPVNSSE